MVAAHKIVLNEKGQRWRTPWFWFYDVLEKGSGGGALGTENKSGRSWTAKKKQRGPWGGGTILCPDFASGYMNQLIELYTKTKKVTLWIVNLTKRAGISALFF